MIVFRWTARISGLLIFGFLALFMVGEGIDFPQSLPVEQVPVEQVAVEQTAVGSLLFAMPEMLVLWKWEGIAGLMI